MIGSDINHATVDTTRADRIRFIARLRQFDSGEFAWGKKRLSTCGQRNTRAVTTPKLSWNEMWEMSLGSTTRSDDIVKARTPLTGIRRRRWMGCTEMRHIAALMTEFCPMIERYIARKNMAANECPCVHPRF